MSNIKIIDRYEYTGFGFPVVIVKAPMRKIAGEWALDLDHRTMNKALALELTKSHSKLTGAQVTFLRKWAGLSMIELGKMLGKSRIAVHKWESFGNRPTNMDENTERVFRMRMMLKAGLTPEQIFQLVLELSEKYERKKAELKLDGTQMAMAA